MPKVNGFAKFMFEFKKQLNEEVSMNQLQILAGKEWKAMSLAERAKWSGKSEKALMKYNCIGQTIESQIKSTDEKRIKDEKIVKSIEEILQKAINKETNGIFNQVFYFFNASYYAKKRNEDIFPAELAIAKFSLKAGIIDTLHMYINPGELPMGYSGEAVHHAKRTHRFEVLPISLGEKSYSVILNKIMEFIGTERFTSEHVPPFFSYSECEDDDVEAAEMTLDKIAVENGHYNAFRIYKADTLLFLLHKHIIENRNYFYGTQEKAFCSVVTAWDMLRRDDFRYSSIGCDIHNDDDNSTNCCLSKVKRLCYSFVQYCLDDRFVKKMGTHFPTTFKLCNDDDNDEDDFEWNLQSKSSVLTSSLSEKFRALSFQDSNLTHSSVHSLNNTFSRTTTNTFQSVTRLRNNTLKAQLSALSRQNTGSSISVDSELKPTTSRRKKVFKIATRFDVGKTSDKDSEHTIKRFEDDASAMDESDVDERSDSWVDFLVKAKSLVDN